MLSSCSGRNKPKTISDLELLIVHGRKVKAPQEYIDYLYRKEFGLTTYQLMEEPAENINIFIKIKEMEARRSEADEKKLKTK